jgi:hypothetical protein
MARGFIGSLLLLLAGAASALAQPALPSDGAAGAPRGAGGAEATAGCADVPAGQCAFPGWGAGTGSADRFWLSGDYLLWWTKSDKAPPLVTGSPADTPFGSAGALGVGTTSVLFGGSQFDPGSFSGGRLTAGLWLGEERSFGVEGSGFLLERRSVNFSAASDAAGDTILARPFLSSLTGDETALLVTFPGAFAGGVAASSTTRLWGAEGNLLAAVANASNGSLTLLAGFRYLDLDGDLRIQSATTVLPAGVIGFNGEPVLAPNGVTVADHFGAHNHFYGGQVGLRGGCTWGRLGLDGSVKVALGSTHEVVSIDGSTALVTPAGVAGTANGGLLALPSNSGRTSRDEFSVVPEVGVRLRVQITEWLSAHVGYDFLYWSDVVRPGDQVSRSVNLTQLPTSAAFGPLVGPAQPAPLFHRTDFWAQGIDFGLELRY